MKNGLPVTRLCYVENQWAYFTTLPLAEQQGDDWDDVPYEHNAEPPYGPYDHPRDYNPDGTPKWRIVKVAFDGGSSFWAMPHDGCGPNSPYCVLDINAGQVPWLRTWDGSAKIMAGTTLDEFRAKIAEAGGRVYEAALEGKAKG